MAECDLPRSQTAGLTIFTSPKPFRGHIGTIQRNAIRSWLQLRLDCQVLIFGDEEGAAELARETGAAHVPDIQRNEFGTPLLDSMFSQARQLGRHPLLCYANADIIFTQDFARAIRQVIRLRRPFLMTGRRLDLDVNEPLTFSPDWEALLLAQTKRQGRWHDPTGMDYFVFRADTWHGMPAFAIGRPLWDNWMIFGALSAGAWVIDATPSVVAIHQNHDYAHLRGGFAEARTGPEAERNRELAQGMRDSYSSENATWLLTRWGLLPAFTVRHLRKRLTTGIRSHRLLRAIARRVRRALHAVLGRGAVAAR